MSARAVINATGVWAGEVDTSIKLRPSRGTHLVFDAKAFGNPVAALTIPIPGEINRFVFAMPEQLGRVYLGLTDEDAPGPIPDVPQPTSERDLVPARHRQHRAGRRARTGRRRRRVRRTAAVDRHRRQGRTADVSREHAVVESTVGCHQRDRRQADRIPVHGRGRSRPRRRAAGADRERRAAPATCRWSVRRRTRWRHCGRRPTCRGRWSPATAPRRRT